MRRWATIAIAAAAMLATVSCNNEINQSSSPILLIVNTTTQGISQYDLAGGTGCDTSIATINVEARVKNPTLDTTFLGTRVTSYRVTYQRVDGGTTVPPQYVRAMDLLLTPGSPSNTMVFHITDFQTIFTQAPFVSLLPLNGGKDPETKANRIKFNVTLELFGQTIAGDRVYGSTTFPLDFCYNCGGCQP